MDENLDNLIDVLKAAQKKAIMNKPKVEGFPYLAEALRQAGVKHNIWSLPSCQSIYVMEKGSVLQQGTPLVLDSVIVPNFDKNSLINAIRTDQAGKSTFGEFLLSTWRAGVVWYKVDFEGRTVEYGNHTGETYIEKYPSVSIKD